MASYRIKHITRYSYPSTVIDCANQIMLYPINDDLQTVKKHTLTITKNPFIEQFTDYFGNTIGIFTIVEPVNEIIIQSEIEVETKPILFHEDEASVSGKWESLSSMRDQFPYMDCLTNESFESADEVRTEVNKIFSYDLSPFDNALALSRFVFEQFEYQKGVTSVETKLDEVWRLKAGVCQDFAHILLVMLRMVGIPARYVSGYICPKNNELRGEGATHAWVEVPIPSAGWIGLDPTNNCVVNDRHVRLAVGRNFSDCTPVKGTYKGSSEHTLEVSVTIDNGHIKTAEEIAAGPTIFSYQTKNPGVDQNSYRRFMEMQQQQ